MHYPGDLIVGSIIGASFGMVIYLGLSLLSRRIEYLPELNQPLELSSLHVGRHRLCYYPSDFVLFIEALTIVSVCIAYLFIL